LKGFEFLEVQIKPAEKTAKNRHKKQKNRPSLNKKPNRMVQEPPKTGNKPNAPNVIEPAQEKSKGARQHEIHHKKR
jgi:hypothetical protein